MFPPEHMQQLELVPGRPSTKGVPVLRMKAPMTMPPDFMFRYGTLLYDMDRDSGQEHPLEDPALEAKMEALLVKLMLEGDAPPEQYERLGLKALFPPEA